jgi:hypothetical protein
VFQAIYEAANRMFVGCGPISPEDEAAIGPDYLVAVIEDDAKFDWLLEQVQWPPYAHLGEDGQTFDLVEEWPSG